MVECPLDILSWEDVVACQRPLAAHGFTLWFLWQENGRPGPVTLICVVAFAGATAWGIAAMFQYGFLVRLP